MDAKLHSEPLNMNLLIKLTAGVATMMRELHESI